jgi:hypothetical protein
MTVAVRLAEPNATRRIRCMDILDFDGWRLKLYGIAYRGERPRGARPRMSRTSFGQPDRRAHLDDQLDGLV